MRPSPTSSTVCVAHSAAWRIKRDENRAPQPQAQDSAGERQHTYRAAKATSSPRRAPRGQNKAKVLDALKDGPMTASQIAKATGIGTGTASTMLTKMAKSGELAKAERGYQLPQ